MGVTGIVDVGMDGGGDRGQIPNLGVNSSPDPKFWGDFWDSDPKSSPDPQILGIQIPNPGQMPNSGGIPALPAPPAPSSPQFPPRDGTRALPKFPNSQIPQNPESPTPRFPNSRKSSSSRIPKFPESGEDPEFFRFHSPKSSGKTGKKIGKNGENREKNREDPGKTIPGGAPRREGTPDTGRGHRERGFTCARCSVSHRQPGVLHGRSYRDTAPGTRHQHRESPRKERSDPGRTAAIPAPGTAPNRDSPREPAPPAASPGSGPLSSR